MCLYESALFLFNLIDGGTEKPYMSRYSESADPTTWSGGNAGTNNLLDVRDSIVGAKPLGRDLIVYRSSGLVRCTFIGGTDVYAWKAINFGESTGTEGVGLVSPNAIHADDDSHVFLSNKGVFEYRGGLSLTHISEAIFFGTFDSEGDLDHNKIHRAFVQFMDRRRELHCFYADDTATFPNKAVILDLSNGKWRKRRWADEMSCSSSRDDVEAVAIQDLVGTILEQTWTYAGMAAAGNTPLLMLGSYGTQVYEYNYVNPMDDDADIPWHFYTKKFRYVDRVGRHDWVAIQAAGAAASIARVPASDPAGDPDGDHTKAIAASAPMREVRGHMQYTDEAIQYKIWGDGGGAELGSLSFKVREESRWGL
jgi:hypothetical protein